MINIALYKPQIPQNTGNIARIAVGLNINLILVGKFGFSLDNKYLKRAGLDYWDSLKISIFHDFDNFQNNFKDQRIVLATTKGVNSYYNYTFKKGDIILFGSETAGLPVDYIKANIKNTITIPMPGNVRSLNLANSVGIIAYHSLYQLGYFNGFNVNRNFNDLQL